MSRGETGRERGAPQVQVCAARLLSQPPLLFLAIGDLAVSRVV